MPRNGSGDYTLVDGNPVVTDTIIESTWANTTLGDVAIALTNSVAADGQTPMTGPLKLGDGALFTPGLAFANETGLGAWRSAAGVMSFVVGNAEIFNFNATSLNSSKPVLIQAAAAGDAILSQRVDAGGTFMRTNAAGNFVVVETNGSVEGNIMFQALRGGKASLYYAGAEILRTTATGILVDGAATGDIFLLSNTGGVALRAEASGSAGIVQTSNAGSVQDNWMHFAINGAVTAYYNNVARMVTSSSGITVTNGIYLVNAVNITQLVSEVNGDFTIRARTLAGAAGDTIFHSNVNAQSTLYYDGNEKFSTNAFGVHVTGGFLATAGNIIAEGTGRIIGEKGTVAAPTFAFGTELDLGITSTAVDIGSLVSSTFTALNWSNLGGALGGTWLGVNSSDATLKTNITGRVNGLLNIRALSGVDWDWNNPQHHEGEGVSGITAQDLQAIYPEMVVAQASSEMYSEVTPKSIERDGKLVIKKPIGFGAFEADVIEAIKELANRLETVEAFH